MEDLIILRIKEAERTTYRINLGAGYSASGLTREQLTTKLNLFPYEQLRTQERIAPHNAKWQFDPISPQELAQIETECKEKNTPP